MRTLIIVSAAALVAAVPASGMAQAASTGAPTDIATVTCGDLAGLGTADQSALIYFAAGYQRGLNAGMSNPAAASGAGTALGAAGGASTQADTSSTIPRLDSLKTATAATDLGRTTVSDPGVADGTTNTEADNAEATSAATSSTASPATSTSSSAGTATTGVSLGVDPQQVIADCGPTPSTRLIDVVPSGAQAGGTVGAGVGSDITNVPAAAAGAPPAGVAQPDVTANSLDQQTQSTSNSVNQQVQENLQQTTPPPAATTPNPVSPAPGATDATPGAASPGTAPTTSP